MTHDFIRTSNNGNTTNDNVIHCQLPNTEKTDKPIIEPSAYFDVYTTTNSHKLQIQYILSAKIIPNLQLQQRIPTITVSSGITVQHASALHNKHLSNILNMNNMTTNHNHC